MIEIIVFEYLKGFMEVPVKMERPANEPEEYILLEKTGSSMEDQIYYATIAVQSYAATLKRAMELNETVKKAMEQLPLKNDVFGCKLNSDYNYTDKTKKKYRYQAVFDLSY